MSVFRIQCRLAGLCRLSVAGSTTEAVAAYRKSELITPTNSRGYAADTSLGSHLKPYTVVVEGNIGAGKSTFLKRLESLNSDIIEIAMEPVHKWKDLKGHNLLELMYSDPVRYSFLLQSYIQLTTLQQYSTPCTKPLRVFERSLLRNIAPTSGLLRQKKATKSGQFSWDFGGKEAEFSSCTAIFLSKANARNCFIENLYARGCLSDPEYSVLCKWFDFLKTNNAFHFRPDLIVYLRTDPRIAEKRILARSRQEESSIPFSYLQDLHNLHEDWLYHRTKFQPLEADTVMIIDANEDMDTMDEIYGTKGREIIQKELINRL